MYKFLKSLFYLFLIVFVFAGCRKAALDAFYGRPATLAPPIYQTLQARGNFTNMLACIDKAGYTNILSTGGYWTLFAPNDAAFAAAKINGSQIDAATATKIVTYSLINSGYISTSGVITSQTAVPSSIELAQNALNSNGGVTIGPAAFKRQTVYHEGFTTDTVPAFTNPNPFGALAGQNITVVSQNVPAGITFSSVINPSVVIAYDSRDFNHKYIPYFTPYYFANAVPGGTLNASDYTTFYPGSTYTNSSTNFNVLGGNVVNGNVICENGVVQEINIVPLPLPNLEKYWASKSNYSHFYNFVQHYSGMTYAASPDATYVNQVNTGSSATVYVKQYPSTLALFSPQNENLLSSGGSTYPQYSDYTFFAPDNATFDAYLNNVLLEHYTTKDAKQLNPSIVASYINSHIAINPIWPSQFGNTLSTTVLGSLTNLNPATDISDPFLCSNGLFYGINKEIGKNNKGANVFATVYGRPYLDPAYSIMTTGLNSLSSFRSILSDPTRNLTLIMLPDATLQALGYSLNPTASQNTTASSGILYQAPGTTGSPVSGDASLGRIIGLCIFSTPNHELDNLSGTGIYATNGSTSIPSEIVKYTNNQFYAAGNQDAGTTVPVNTPFLQATNGIVYYPAASNTVTLSPTAPVAPSISTVGTDLFNKGQVAPVGGVGGDPYYMFFSFLKNSSALWPGGPTSTARQFAGIDLGTDYTILVPSNAAIQDAVNNGWLPGTGTGAIKTANFAPTAPADINLVVNFIKYHIVKSNQIVPDGKKSGKYTTLLFSNDGNNVLLQFNNNVNALQVIDGQGRIANVGAVSSIVLADHAVIESIDTYLQYLDSTLITPANPNPTKY